MARSSTSCERFASLPALVAIVVICAASPAFAEEPEWYRGVPKATQGQASDLFRKGNGHFEQNEYARAAELYEQAVALWDHPGIHFNLAVSLVNLDRVLEAYDHLQAALRFGPKGLEKTRYQDAQTYKRLLEGRLVPLSVETTQDGVEVTLDGKPIQSGAGRAQLTVLPGIHALVATKPGFETLTKSLTLVGGAPVVERVVLSPRQRQVRLERRYRTWVPWTIAGIGAGVALLGGGALVLARAHEREFETQFASECPLGCRWEEPGKNVDWKLHDRAEIEHVTGLGLASLGGGLVLTGLIMVALNQPREVPIPGGVAVTSDGTGFHVVWAGRL